MQRQKCLKTERGSVHTARFWRYSFTDIYSLAVALVVIAGCAPTSVKPVRESTGKLPRPSRILVYDFAVSPGEVSLDRAVGARLANLVKGTPRTEKELEVGRAAASTLSKYLVKGIQDLGLPAERAYAAPSVRENTLLIKGQFLSIDEGNRTERMVIGLGAGRSEVATYCQVYEATGEGRQLVLDFETASKSGRKPGIAEMAGVGAVAGHAAESAAVATGVGVASEALADDVEADVRRTAKELTKQLSGFFVSQGWISADKSE